MLVLLTCLGHTWSVENPGSSVIGYFPRFKWLFRAVRICKIPATCHPSIVAAVQEAFGKLICQFLNLRFTSNDFGWAIMAMLTRKDPYFGQRARPARFSIWGSWLAGHAAAKCHRPSNTATKLGKGVSRELLSSRERGDLGCNQKLSQYCIA